jgi:hypothetical protein
MTDKPKKLSDTARALLAFAATRDDHLILPPRLPIAAARQVARSLLGSELAEEVPASGNAADLAWPVGDGGGALVLRATAVGLARIVVDAETTTTTVVTGMMTEAQPMVMQTGSGTGKEATAVAIGHLPSGSALPQARDGLAGPEEADGPATAVAVIMRPDESATRGAGRAGLGDDLRAAAQVLLDAWDELPGSNISPLARPIAGLRATLVALPTSISVAAPRAPRDTKHAQVLAMLRRTEGASGPQIAEAMGWAPHTVRGFLAALVKKGIHVEVLDRIRQIGPSKQGAKGSYTVYQVSCEVGE